MHNLIPAFTFFIFVFCTLALIKLIIDFVRAIFSDPPKPFEVNNIELSLYGIFISYILTYLIYI